MAVTRRGFIYSAFILSVLCVLCIIISIISDSWVSVTLSAASLERDSYLKYGLFSGELELYNLITPTYATFYMTCVPALNACALSCKTEEEARFIEVEAMAQGFWPSLGCGATTEIDTIAPSDNPPVISFAFYVSLLTIIFLQLLLGIVSGGLAIVNACKNPVEPALGLPGCLWMNLATAVLGVIVLLLFGLYWLISGLKEHLAVSYIAQGVFEAAPTLGYSYLILITSVLCNLVNVGLIELRVYLLERDPPSPVIEVDNHNHSSTLSY
ncbi:hypothetical protein K1T71_013725 [Dendrolimus kikuchii]|uniref:Uncharacterized protein n=1 Tax=Dendrolimus kikuchii TaxID=765133 RepID=A0ACC1CHF6_9NEOP|nr:hypothetical protein K1T71_013725 [Dendrolimus kikuchii]